MNENIIDTTEKVVLIGLITQHQDEDKSNEYLDELEFLTLTAGGKAVKRFVQKLENPNPKTFIGTGPGRSGRTGCCQGRPDSDR